MAPLNEKLVLFGGVEGPPGAPQIVGDTWTWDGAVWTTLSAPGPAARTNAVMAPVGGKLVLFGGIGFSDPNAYPMVSPCLSDTWTWDGTAWTPSDATGPSARGLAVMGTP
jgi:hypothetical protein